MTRSETAAVASDVPSADRRRVLLLLEFAERAAVLLLYGALLFRVLREYAANGGADNLILLVSEGLVVFFVLIRRRATSMSGRITDWIFTAVATIAPLLVQPTSGHSLFPAALGGGFMLVGIAIQVAAKLSLGRSFGCAPAHRGLRLSGPYRIVRHPMYAGYFVCHLAFLLMNCTAWNLVVYAVCYIAQIPRLLAEERLLIRDAGYQQYVTFVRFRLIPGLF